jgi:hypothetical protein
MLEYSVWQVVKRTERDFMPDEYRVVTKLSEKTMFYHKWPDQRIWIRGDGSRFREMHTLGVQDAILGKVEDFVDVFWSALINNIEGNVGEFRGPFQNNGWRPAFLNRNAVFVKFDSSIDFGSPGILKNCVWNFRKIKEENTDVVCTGLFSGDGMGVRRRAQ